MSVHEMSESESEQTLRFWLGAILAIILLACAIVMTWHRGIEGLRFHEPVKAPLTSRPADPIL